MTAEDALESQLATLAAYHVGLFTGAVAVEMICRNAQKHGFDATALVAHALWLLAREAEKRREEWLTSQQNGEEDQ